MWPGILMALRKRAVLYNSEAVVVAIFTVTEFDKVFSQDNG
jgi:hypothetical protein